MAVTRSIRGAADVHGRRVVEGAVDDTGAVEAGDDRGAAGDGGGFEPADLLHPAHRPFCAIDSNGRTLLASSGDDTAILIWEPPENR